MEKRLKDYIAKMEEVANKLKEDRDNDTNLANRKTLGDEMLVQIGFFQHERLVHLLVTILFAILAMFGLILMFISCNIGLIFLEILFIVLLVPYIRHYYILENGVQKLYEIYDEIID